MNKWRIAESLKKLREEINAEFPTRSKVSDGAIGDAAHASRSSDHNPWIQDGGTGVVSAIDITHDPKSGCTGEKLATALVESRDPRIKYLIWNRRIIASYPTGGKPAWTWRPYSGANAHAHHLHISVSDKKSLYDSRDDWDLNFDMAVTQPIHRSAADIQQGEERESPEPISSPSPLAAESPSQQADAGAVATQVNLASAPHPLPVVDPDAPAIQASQGGKKSLWATLTTGAAAIPATIIGLIQGNADVIKWVIVVVGVLGSLYLLRQTILDVIRMWAASDQTRNQVK